MGLGEPGKGFQDKQLVGERVQSARGNEETPSGPTQCCAQVPGDINLAGVMAEWNME